MGVRLKGVKEGGELNPSKFEIKTKPAERRVTESKISFENHSTLNKTSRPKLNWVSDSRVSRSMPTVSAMQNQSMEMFHREMHWMAIDRRQNIIISPAVMHTYIFMIYIYNIIINMCFYVNEYIYMCTCVSEKHFVCQAEIFYECVARMQGAKSRIIQTSPSFSFPEFLFIS